jgi:flagellar basal-body rod modification protein FlgD
MVDISDYLANQTPSGSYVDTSGGGAGGTIANGQKTLGDSYTTFLTLLTAQLKNQDPLSPLDTNAFTQQLVQMTGVQQQLLSNELLQKLVTASDSGSGYDAVALIGKTATAKGDETQLAGGEARWAYSLPDDAAGAVLTVVDSTGKTVWTGDATELSEGRHAFVWNGKDTSGAALPDGLYKLRVAAVGSDGKALLPTVYFTGRVSSVEQSNGQTLLKIGPSKVGLPAVAEVTG